MHAIQRDDPKQETVKDGKTAQTQTAFQNLTIQLSQWSRADYLKH